MKDLLLALSAILLALLIVSAFALADTLWQAQAFFQESTSLLLLGRRRKRRCYRASTEKRVCQTRAAKHGGDGLTAPKHRRRIGEGC